MTGPLETVKKALQAYVDKDRALIDSVIGRAVRLHQFARQRAQSRNRF